MNDIAGTGQMQPSDTASEFNVVSFIIQQQLARTRSMTLVKVLSVTNAGGIEPVGSVDVQPLVQMLDGANVATSHGKIFNVPYSRLQGGANAIIIDPKVGDIGWMAVSDRDISNVKSTKAEAPPGSFRRFDLADGVYLGGILNAAPTQYVRFTDDLVELVSPTRIRIVAPTVEIEASTQFHVTGPALVTGDLTVTGAINAASAAITGAITAASAAITGAVTAASVALSGALTALSAAITNLMSAGSITSSSTITATTQVTAAGIGLTTHHHTTTINVPSTPSGNLPFASGSSQA